MGARTAREPARPAPTARRQRSVHATSPRPAAAASPPEKCEHLLPGRRRIAELGEGKRALWGILSMQPKANKPTEPATAEPATSMQPRQGPAAEASAPAEARSRQDVVTSADAALSEIKLVDALASREADLARREAAVRKAEDEVGAGAPHAHHVRTVQRDALAARSFGAPRAPAPASAFGTFWGARSRASSPRVLRPHRRRREPCKRRPLRPR